MNRGPANRQAGGGGAAGGAGNYSNVSTSETHHTGGDPHHQHHHHHHHEHHDHHGHHGLPPPMVSAATVEEKEQWTLATLFFLPVARCGYILFVLLSPFPSFFVVSSNFRQYSKNTSGSQITTTPEDYGAWGERFTAFSWLVLLVLFFAAFAHYMKYCPLMSGRPKELLKVIPECRGNVAVTLVTPTVDEDYALLLRTLLGRTATAFYTVANDEHKLRGIYVDAMLNEERRKNIDEYRKALWRAWNSFLLEVISYSNDVIDPDALEQNSLNQLKFNTVEVNFQAMSKLMEFLDGWLANVERNELTYNYSLSVHYANDTEK
jgi:hypothetical protein